MKLASLFEDRAKALEVGNKQINHPKLVPFPFQL